MVLPQHALQADALWKILEVSRKLSITLELEEVLEEVMTVAREVLNVEAGSVFLYVPDTEELVTRVATGQKEIRVPMNSGIVGECASTQALINVPDCYSDPRFNADVDKLTGFKTHCLLAVPLLGMMDGLVGVLELINKPEGSFDENDERLATVLAGHCALALQRARLFEDHLVRKKQDHDLSIARDIQQGVLPDSMPQLAGYEVVGWSQSADQTGGDIYDAVSLSPEEASFLLADATGHGIGPALSVTQVRAMFRVAVHLHATLDDQLHTLNRQLSEDLAANRFVTAFLGFLNTHHHRLTYHSAGQGPLLLFHRATQEWESRSASTIPLSISAKLPMSSPDTVTFAPGDLFAVFSDGFFEYPNPQGELFGEERVMELIQRHAHEPLPLILETLRDSIEAFAAGTEQPDDMTALLFKRVSPDDPT